MSESEENCERTNYLGKKMTKILLNFMNNINTVDTETQQITNRRNIKINVDTLQPNC